MWNVLAQPLVYGLKANKGTVEKLTSFCGMIEDFAQMSQTADALTTAREIVRRSGLWADIFTGNTVEDKSRQENMQELMNAISDFVDTRREEGNNSDKLIDYINSVQLLTDQDTEGEGSDDHITLMTVHSAKGLEFRTTYIVGLEEGLFPSAFCQTTREIEEERRLLYVAITRSMERCYLLNARQRFRNGQVTFTTPSRFLKEIDQQYLFNANSTVSARRPQPVVSPASGVATSTHHSRLAPTTGMHEKGEKRAIRSEWSKGDRVAHRVFGKGTVLEVYRENDNDKIDIQFDEVGKKTLLVTYAKLTRLS
jgi:DNA helicase-2/ATP-dependent DNA helicase PcrA